MFKLSGEAEYVDLEVEAKNAYILQAGDQITVNVFTNDGFKLIDAGIAGAAGAGAGGTVIYDLSTDGYVRLPFIDSVQLVGLTEFETAELLEHLYSDHIKDPFVQVSVVNRRAFVYRGNEDAAVVPLVYENMTLVEVIAFAGGIPATGKAYKVKLIRGAPTEPKISELNLRNPENLEGASIIVEANDIIYIEPAFELTFLEQIGPVLAIVSSGLAIYVLVTR
jgi:polysaccharide export outer membrane protein